MPFGEINVGDRSVPPSVSLSRTLRGGWTRIGIKLDWVTESAECALYKYHPRFAECNVQLCVTRDDAGAKGERCVRARTHIYKISIYTDNARSYCNCTHAVHCTDVIIGKHFAICEKAPFLHFPPARHPYHFTHPLLPPSPSPPSFHRCAKSRESQPRGVYALRRGEINFGMMYYTLGEFASIVPREKITALPARFLELWERNAARRSIRLISLLYRRRIVGNNWMTY